MHVTIRPALIALCVASGLAFTPPAIAASDAKKSSSSKSSKSAKSPKSSKSGTSAKPTQTAKSGRTASKAKAPALSAAQLLMADQVYTGRADCEFQRFVTVERTSIEGGSFRVRHRGKTYSMVPEETSTGAVRLVDYRAGVVWIQIPVKSMLLNDRLGQRIIDACAVPAQREAQAAAAAAPATSVPASMLGREDSIPAGMMPAPAGAASAPGPLLGPSGRS